MMRSAVAGLAAMLLVGATAGSVGSADHTIQAGARLFVGIPLTCGVDAARSAIGVVCVERNPGNDQVYPNSLGVAILAGKQGRVAIQYYDKDRRPNNLWVYRQPRHAGTGLFPTGKRGKDIFALPGDRYAIGGTNLLCPVLQSLHIVCAVVNTKTLSPVPGTYLIDGGDKSVEIDRVTRIGRFETIRTYNEPKLTG